SESLLLFVLGGIAGFAVLFGARRILLQFVPPDLPRLTDPAISWGVLAFALAVSVAAGTIFGLAPAWLASRLDLTEALRQEGRGSLGSRRRARLRHALVIGELALSLTLLVAAGLLLRSFWALYQVQLGFTPTRVAIVKSSLPNPNDPQTDRYRTATQEGVLLRAVLARIRTIPGVEEAAVSDEAAIPLGHAPSERRMIPLVLESQQSRSRQPPLIATLIVSPEYFHLLGMPLQRGRLFVDQDLEPRPRSRSSTRPPPPPTGPTRTRSASASICSAAWAGSSPGGPPSWASSRTPAPNRSPTPACRRCTSTSTSAPSNSLPSTCAARSIPPPSPTRRARRSRPWIRSCRCRPPRR